MNEQEIKLRLARAIQDTKPDVLSSILSRCDEGERNMEITGLTVVPEKTKTTNFKLIRRAAAGFAAALVLAVGAFAGYRQLSVDSVIGIDVNPSIELKTNYGQRVIGVNALNSDAQVVIDGMKLKGVDVEVAVNALIGSMLKHGYVDDIKNSILISVVNPDSSKSRQLQEKLSAEVSELLAANTSGGSVISQTLGKDSELASLASQYSISEGKVSLIQAVIAENPHLKFDELAKLSINDINLLAQSAATQPQGITTSGVASTGAYITKEKAKELALAHAGITESGINFHKIKLDWENGRMVYELEFYYNGGEYDYDIDALNGSVVSFDHDLKKIPQQSTTTPPPSSSSQSASQSKSYIGEEKAKQIAMSHAGVSNPTYKKVELDYDDGRHKYEVDFYVNGREYEYDIDAYTGDILKYDHDYDDDRYKQSSSQSASSQSSSSARDMISKEKAQQIALSHAGVSNVTYKKSKLDHYNGRYKYEVDFYADGMEYEYDIDAYTGEVIKYDQDYDDDYYKHSSSQSSSSSSSGLISAEKAKQIALNKAGISSATFEKVELDEDDGRWVYEIEFRSGRTEYECDIDATTGSIIDWDMDYDD